MSITVQVKEYCHECPIFKPECKKTLLQANNGHTILNNTVVCVDNKKCDNIYNYFKWSCDSKIDLGKAS